MIKKVIVIVAAAFAALAAAVLGVSAASASTGTPPCQSAMSAHAKTGQSLAGFASDHSTDPVSVIGKTWACEQLPPGFAAYVNTGDWNSPLPGNQYVFYYDKPGSQA